VRDKGVEQHCNHASEGEITPEGHAAEHDAENGDGERENGEHDHRESKHRWLNRTKWQTGSPCPLRQANGFFRIVKSYKNREQQL